MSAATVTSGSPALDDALGGGWLQGDNVIWAAARGEPYDAVEQAFVEASVVAHPTVYVACTPAALERQLPRRVERFDASAGSALATRQALAAAIEDWMRTAAVSSIVISDFDALATRWGDDEARRFFVHTCPAMLQAGAVTYWRTEPGLHGVLVDACRQVTQCMLELSTDRLRVVKAEGRPRPVQGSVHEVSVDDGALTIVAQSAGGRLARGLVRLRGDLDITQAELAAAAGVTPSAISQAESGSRGLAIDTLIALSDRLGVSIDRIVNGEPAPGYRLTRHDRVPGAASAVPLVDDASVGLRAYYVSLAPDEHRSPPAVDAWPQLVTVVDGLVQVALGADRPVLRAGDALLVESLAIESWHNLRGDPAAFYWIVREDLRAGTTNSVANASSPSC